MDFVSFEIANKLKEKGFREKCLTYYDVVDNVGLLYNTQYTNDLSPCQYTDLLQSHNTDVAACQSDDSEYCVDAPTISQVLKWLRDEKGIHITICVCGDGWFYEVINISSGKSLVEDYEDDMIQSYEEAAIAGIEYVLNNLI